MPLFNILIMKQSITEKINQIKTAKTDKNISQQKAEYLIKIGAARAVIGNIGNFAIKDCDTLIDGIIKHHEAQALFRYIRHFPPFNQDQIINRMIEQKEFDVIADNIAFFHDKHHNLIAKLLIHEKKPDKLIINLKQFKHLKKDIIYQLMHIDPYYAHTIIENINSFDLALSELDRTYKWLNGEI